MATKLTSLTTRLPRWTIGLAVGAALGLAAAAVVPSVWPDLLPGLSPVRVDTDPENMLDEHEAVRVFHHQMKDAFALHDIVVLGVVNEEDPDGVFNPHSLQRIFDLTEFARGLCGAALGEEDPRAGVVEVDLIAPSTVDSIEQAGPGTVRFERLMEQPPRTREEAHALRERARRIPFLEGTLVSEDGRAVALYLPLTSKDLSYPVYRALREHIAGFDGDERYYIAGLPVAEDTFGVEMFIQMAVSAPLAMVVIFLLMLYFFRKLVLIVSPMIVAMLSVIVTMALLIVTGNTIHIMSSMIPIFIMPISVLDSIHILSEFFDRYPSIRDRRKTITEVVHTLWRPMLFTSLTSAAGFASLMLTPIPPVRVFGAFVAIGVLVAWLLTITFIPAYVMLIPERLLAGFGGTHTDGETRMTRLLQRFGALTCRRARAILALSLVAVAVAAFGISRIQINDNPTRWFRESHPIREADRVLNAHFGGTYMAYLALTPPEGVAERDTAPVEPAETEPASEEPSLPAGLGGLGAPATEPAPPAAAAEPAADELFKRPDVLRYVERVQTALAAVDVVGKSNSVADLVKTVHRDLVDGSEAAFRIPDSAAGVAQTLLQLQSSHRPDDLWHFVTPDYRTANLWVQLKSGDNRDMERVVASMDEFFAENPPPAGLAANWYGLTYINVVWQEKMVWGMASAFLGSFAVVLLMMTVLFRSPLWGLLSMIPLTLTIGLIYGMIGLIGKDYDMPVAVLSALTLGLAVDFAIHFLARARTLYSAEGGWRATVEHVFAEPARAITRNVIVIAVGFTPLLAAPLVPYNTVGVFLAAILLVSGGATLTILPALLRVLEKRLFRKEAVMNRRPRTAALWILLLLPPLATAAAAEDGTPDVDAIVQKTNHVAYYQGDDGRARATLTIRDSRGRERVKEFTILRKDVGKDDGDQLFYVYFHAPADERGTTFLVHKHLDREDDRWLYLPALDVQKRIAASDKRTSFVGSNFFYEDVSGRRLDDDRHELVEVTDTYYVLKNTPLDPAAVEFDSFTMWIHKGTLVPVEVKYEKGGEVYRTVKTLAVKDIEGHMTVTKSQVSDLRTGGSTTLEYRTVEYDVGLNDELFGERYLRTPPADLVN